MTFTLCDKHSINEVDWVELSVLLEAGGLNQRPPALVEQAWRNSTFAGSVTMTASWSPLPAPSAI